MIACRAFASLGDFVAATGHLLKDSGAWMAMKGKRRMDEMAGARRGPQRFTWNRLIVPALAAERCLIWIERPAMKRAHAHEDQ